WGGGEGGRRNRRQGAVGVLVLKVANAGFRGELPAAPGSRSACRNELSKKRGDPSTMAVRPVHWHEGMFLRPHHFQAAQRHTQYLTHLGEKWDHYYNWGLCSADIDRDALANNRFVVRGPKARLRDGSLVSIPEEGTLPTVDLKTAFEGNTHPTVYLAVPVANLGKANVCTNGTGEGAR